MRREPTSADRQSAEPGRSARHAQGRRDGLGATSAHLASLQQTAGNRAVASLLAPAAVQRHTVTVATHDYKVLHNLPGTNYQIVRRDYRPGSARFFYHTPTGTLLGATLTSQEGNQVVAVFQDLIAQGVASLNKMVEHIDHESAKTIPVPVTLARLRLIHRNLRDVVRIRIAADHALIRAMLGNRIDANFNTAFDSIEIPGSDPHKGGQVVVFVNYHRTPAPGRERIVYKPSDLAIDQLLYGDQPGSVARQLGATMANYAVVPLTDVVAADERRRRYGYLQFVESSGPTTAAEVRAVYRSLGENLAVAYVFGLRDIHYENFLLLRDRVLFIDMEAATGTYTGFGAMEFLALPNALAGKIAKGLTGIDGATLAGWLPNDAALLQEVENGFVAAVATLNAGPNVGASVTAFSALSARFVPFTTDSLQRLAGRFLGKLGAHPRQADLDAFTRMTQDVVDAAAAALGNPAGLDAALLTLLRHQTTRDALNVGDVPFWKRVGDRVMAEDGTVLVAHMPHPRLAATAAIAAGANTRRGNAAQALTDYRAAIPAMLGTPSTRVLSQHPFERALAGLPP